MWMNVYVKYVLNTCVNLFCKSRCQVDFSDLNGADEIFDLGKKIASFCFKK